MGERFFDIWNKIHDVVPGRDWQESTPAHSLKTYALQVILPPDDLDNFERVFKRATLFVENYLNAVEEILGRSLEFDRQSLLGGLIPQLWHARRLIYPDYFGAVIEKIHTRYAEAISSDFLKTLHHEPALQEQLRYFVREVANMEPSTIAFFIQQKKFLYGPEDMLYILKGDRVYIVNPHLKDKNPKPELIGYVYGFKRDFILSFDGSDWNQRAAHLKTLRTSRCRQQLAALSLH